MADPTEADRRAESAKINAKPAGRAVLEARHGRVWSPRELARSFHVLGFRAPYVVVRRKSDGQLGSLVFQNEPRYYFSFQADLR